MTDVDEHPTIFNEWQINRTLAGEKTQMRLIVKPQPDHVLHGRHAAVESPIEVVEDGELVEKTHADNGNVFVDEIPSPYGREGDILWVWEAFRFPAVNDAISPSEYVGAGCNVWLYEADETIHDPGGWTERHDFEWGRLRPSIYMPRELCRLRPSIYMPRELCRLRLRVEDVRVERVQEISQQDAIAEGLEKKVTEPRYAPDPIYGTEGLCWASDPTTVFQELWDEIHGDGAWERNDWVWVVSFSRIDDK